jgi:hypothetical protein
MIVPVTVQAIQVPVVDVNKLRTAIEGKSLTEARAFLSQYGKVEITLSPSWASTVPSFDFRIDIQLVLPSTQPSISPPASGRASPSRAGGANNPGAGQPTAAVAATTSPPIEFATAAASPTAIATASLSPNPTPASSPSTLPAPSATVGVSPSSTP